MQAKTAALALIEKERDGELIDRTLLKNILAIFIEVGMGGMECYERDFEVALLSETSTFYKRKAALWIDQVWRGGEGRGVDRSGGAGEGCGV